MVTRGLRHECKYIGIGTWSRMRACSGDLMDDELRDARSDRGHLILANPARMRARDGITVIGFAPSWSEAARSIHEETEDLLRGLDPRGT